MKISTSTDYWVKLDERERWDHSVVDGGRTYLTIEVEQVHITRSDSDGAASVWLIGPRRLLNGKLSVQEPHYVWAKIADIPDARWRDLKAAGAL